MKSGVFSARGMFVCCRCIVIQEMSKHAMNTQFVVASPLAQTKTTVTSQHRFEPLPKDGGKVLSTEEKEMIATAITCPCSWWAENSWNEMQSHISGQPSSAQAADSRDLTATCLFESCLHFNLQLPGFQISEGDSSEEMV